MPDVKENEGKPRNIAVLLVLNEVAHSSMNGGGAREKRRARWSKPEFVLVCDRKSDCFKVLTAFKQIFSRDERENKKECYDLALFEHDEASGNLTPALEKLMSKYKRERSNGKNQKTVTLEQIDEEVDNGLTSTMT